MECPAGEFRATLSPLSEIEVRAVGFEPRRVRLTDETGLPAFAKRLAGRSPEEGLEDLSSTGTFNLLRATMGPEHYIVHFQIPGYADRRLAADVGRVFDRIMRKGIKASDLDTSRGIQNLATAVESGDVLGQPLLSAEERAVFVRAYERTGFTGGINWHRNIGTGATRSSFPPRSRRRR